MDKSAAQQHDGGRLHVSLSDPRGTFERFPVLEPHGQIVSAQYNAERGAGIPVHAAEVRTG